MDYTRVSTSLPHKRRVHTLKIRLYLLSSDRSDGAGLEAPWRSPSELRFMTLVLLSNWVIDSYDYRKLFKLIYCLLNV